MDRKPTFPPILVLILLVALLSMPPDVVAGALIQALDSGHIDWSAGTVRASGFAGPVATDDGVPADCPAELIDTARRTAQANLLQTVSAVRINAGSRVVDRMTQSAAFREVLASLAQNAAVTRQEYSDSGLQIELSMSLTGGFGQFVLPEEIRQVDSITTLATAEPMLEGPSKPEADADSGPHTGLIVDASGIQAKPSLVPLIVDELGDGVYGPAFVSREYAVSRGMSGFAATLPAARNDPRVGGRPMVVKAIRTHISGETDLVIANADAARLRSSVVHLTFLKACRVTVVIAAEDGSP